MRHDCASCGSAEAGRIPLVSAVSYHGLPDHGHPLAGRCEARFRPLARRRPFGFDRAATCGYGDRTFTDEALTVAKSELGTKRIDPETGRKFYDLNKDPIVSPYTGKTYPRSYFESGDEKIDRGRGRGRGEGSRRRGGCSRGHFARGGRRGRQERRRSSRHRGRGRCRSGRRRRRHLPGRRGRRRRRRGRHHRRRRRRRRSLKSLFPGLSGTSFDSRQIRALEGLLLA